MFKSCGRESSRMRLASAFVAILLLATFAAAQPTSGSIRGRVFDQQHLPVEGAAVSVTLSTTGFTQKTTTDANGTYVVRALPPGTYSILVEKSGFAQVRSDAIVLHIDDEVAADFTLPVGAAAQTVTVESPRTALDTDNASVGEVIDRTQILNLPLLGRNFLDLAQLAPGVAPSSGGNNLNLSIGGGREFANSVLVDGVEVTTNRNNDTNLRPSVDSVEEFKVLTSTYTAEYGRASGGIIAIETRSGTNENHGSVYGFSRPSTTAARSYFSSQPSALHQNNFGATFGGPIRRQSTFFFASYERQRLRDAYSYLDSVPPTSDIRFLANGDADLSGLKDPLTGNEVPIFDPATGQQFSGNIIPAPRVSSAGKAVLLNFFPRPTLAGTMNGWFNNFQSRQAYAFDANTGDARLDHYLSQSDRLFAVYHASTFASTLGDRFAGTIPVSGGGDADYSGTMDQQSHSVAVAETHAFSSQLLNEARVGFVAFSLTQDSLLQRRNLASHFGLANINVPGVAQTSGFPYIYLGSGYVTGGSTYKPLAFADRNFEAYDNFTATASRHTLRSGGVFRLLTSHPRFSMFPATFQYFGGPYSSLTSDPTYSFFDPNAFFGNGGSDLADLLLGLPLSVTEGMQFTSPTSRSWELAGYAQDSWRANSRLVVLLGVRYEFQSPWRETSNAAANLDLNTATIRIAGRGDNSATLVQNDRNNFAPRLGLSLQLAPKTVVRAGYGLYYSPENDARSDILTKNYPFAIEQTFYNDIYSGPPFAYTLDAGVPRKTTLGALPPSGALTAAAARHDAGSTQNIFAISPSLRTGYTHQYNLSVQQALSHQTMLEASYVGSSSHRLPYAFENLNINQRISSDLGQVQVLTDAGAANYNSLQVSATRRSSSLGFLIAYTFSRTIDNGPAPFNLGHNLNQHNQPQSPFNLSAERSVADADIPQKFTASVVYELPIGRGRRFATRSGIADAMFGGWQVSGIFTARSGTPFNIVRGVQDAGYSGLRPDIIGNPALSDAKRTLQRYFDVSAFSTARFTGAHAHDTGDSPRNLLRGPGYSNLDLALFKTLKLRERYSLQLRAESFNTTNTPQFANPNAVVSAGNFGSITRTVGNPRVLQFAAKLAF